jgi:hypothetical protein
MGFWIMPGFEDDPRLLHDPPRYDGTLLPSLPGMCAGGPRWLLDLTRAYVKAETSAGQAWDLWQRLTAEMPGALPLSAFLADTGKSQSRTGLLSEPFYRAVDEYLRQPFMQAFLSADVGPRGARISVGFDRWDQFELPAVDPVVVLAGEREEFVGNEVSRAARRTDLLTLDGWWVEARISRSSVERLTRGIPVHGACDSPATCPHMLDLDERAYRADITAYLEVLPEDAVIVSLKCHT